MNKTVKDFLDEGAEWRNARISFAEIEVSRGFVVPYVTLDGGGWGVNFGAVRVAHGADDWFVGLMKCAGVELWSVMVGRHIRVLTRGLGGSITVVAHITDDEIVFDQRAWATALRGEA